LIILLQLKTPLVELERDLLAGRKQSAHLVRKFPANKLIGAPPMDFSAA
jgi:hypothetical protein